LFEVAPSGTPLRTRRVADRVSQKAAGGEDAEVAVRHEVRDNGAFVEKRPRVGLEPFEAEGDLNLPNLSWSVWSSATPRFASRMLGAPVAGEIGYELKGIEL